VLQELPHHVRELEPLTVVQAAEEWNPLEVIGGCHGSIVLPG